MFFSNTIQKRQMHVAIIFSQYNRPKIFAFIAYIVRWGVGGNINLDLSTTLYQVLLLAKTVHQQRSYCKLCHFVWRPLFTVVILGNHYKQPK